jgi:hypothetical protein
MADLGEQVPPLAAVFCRLYLLQGVAYHYGNNPNKAKAKLDWAYQVCSSLRAVSSPEAVSSLCEAMPGITTAQAISALRRTNGNRDQAVGLLEHDEQNAARQEETRRKQRELGLCQDTMQYVDPDLISKLQSVLSIPSSCNVASLATHEGESRQVAVGLLRLANNSLDQAIDIYQDVERSSQVIHQRVSQLDANLANQGLETPTKSKKRPRESIVVDEVALATLVSMGVDEQDAKQALRASNNNTDASLVWLTSEDDKTTAQEANFATAGAKDEDMEEDDSNADEPMSEASSRNEHESKQDKVTLEQKRLETDEAMELLQQELGAALSARDMEKEYLGSSLDEEWEYLIKFVGANGSERK